MEKGNLDALVQEKIEADEEFQSSLESLPEEDREQALNEKRLEIIGQEVDSLRKKAEEAEKNKELANNYKIRAEKAEKFAKELKGTPKNPEPEPKAHTESELSQKDLIALMKSDVPEEDVDTVIKWSKLNEVTLSEALKSEEVKAILNVRSEQRKTADATNTQTTRRVDRGVTGEEILKKAYKNQMPESEEDMDKLIEARFEAKKRKK